METGGQEYWETNEWLADRVFEHITKYIGEVFKESCRRGTEPKRSDGGMGAEAQGMSLHKLAK